MSENIQSISQGTYTIGQTSATNFVAGPGIKIDEPSAGTVRIGNDETVLYSANSVTNNTVGQVFPMSEPITNFERIRIICDNMEYQNRPCMQEFPVLNSSCRFNMPMLNDNGGTSISINIPYATYNINSSGDLVCAARGLFYGDWNTPYHTNGDWRGYCLLKVVGINRISGGNE